MSDYLATADAETILDLIAAEFQSDPQSVQCFDLRVVERAIELSKAWQARQRQRSAKGPTNDYLALASRLRSHAELVIGAGTNATHLRADLFAAADVLAWRIPLTPSHRMALISIVGEHITCSNHAAHAEVYVDVVRDKSTSASELLAALLEGQ
jgi:hypothetical protein